MNNRKPVLLGLMAGVAIVVIMLSLDMINSDLLISTSMSYFPTLVLIFAMIFAARESKKYYEYFSFSMAFKSALFPFMIGNGIYLFFNYLLYNFIDPDLAEKAKEKALSLIEDPRLGSLLPENQREEMVEIILENTFQPTLMETLMSYMFSLIVPGALVALLLALIFRTRIK